MTRGFNQIKTSVKDTFAVRHLVQLRSVKQLCERHVPISYLYSLSGPQLGGAGHPVPPAGGGGILCHQQERYKTGGKKIEKMCTTPVIISASCL